MDVGGFTFTENFYDDKTWTMLGIPIGTVSQIQMNAAYRYHVPLEVGEWRIGLDEKKKNILVLSPRLLPTLPIAFDSNSVRQQVKGGDWIPFNDDQKKALDELRKSVTQALMVRALQEDHLAQARPKARDTIEEFIKAWVLENKFPEYANYNIKVLFPGEEGYTKWGSSELPDKTQM